MLLGLLIMGIVGPIPILGGMVVMIGAMFGVGGLALAAWQAYHHTPVAAGAPVMQPTPAPLQAAA